MENALVLLNLLFGVITVLFSLFALGVLYKSKFFKKMPFMVLALIGVLTIANVRKVSFLVAKELGQVQDHDVYVYVENLEDYQTGDLIEFPFEPDMELLSENPSYGFITYEEDGVVKPIKHNTSTSITLKNHFKGKDKLVLVKNEKGIYDIKSERQNLRLILTENKRFDPESVVFK